jgi:outer membrane biosynthesis protein TonB
MMRPAFIVPGRPNFLERHFKIFVAVPVVATALCIVAFACWNLTHRSQSVQAVADIAAGNAVSSQPVEVTAPPGAEVPRPAMSVMEDVNSELASAQEAPHEEAAPTREKPEAPPAPEPSAPAAPTPPVTSSTPPKKKAGTDESPYVVPKNKPFINRDQFLSAPTNEKPPQKPAPKVTPATPKPPAKNASNKNRATLKTFVLKNGQRIDAVSIADSGNTYVVETPAGGTETFAKADVYLIIKK